MKKTAFIFFSCFIIFLFFSCNVDIKDTNLLIKPDIDISTQQTIVIVHKVNNDSSYINIYRQEVSNDDEVKPVYNIGLLYPKSIDTNEITYRFIDELVFKDTSYRYRARYCDEDGYHYTDWSNVIKVESNFPTAYDSNKKIVYTGPSDIGFTFDEINYTLKLSAALTAPEIQSFTDYQPMLIVNNGVNTQVFKISSDCLTNRQAITLKDRLPIDFLDRNIIIEGVLAQKYEYINPEADAASRIIKSIHWTLPTKIKVNGYSDNIICIPSSLASSGLDYTSKTDHL